MAVEQNPYQPPAPEARETIETPQRKGQGKSQQFFPYVLAILTFVGFIYSASIASSSPEGLILATTAICFCGCLLCLILVAQDL